MFLLLLIIKSIYLQFLHLKMNVFIALVLRNSGNIICYESLENMSSSFTSLWIWNKYCCGDLSSQDIAKYT